MNQRLVHSFFVLRAVAPYLHFKCSVLNQKHIILQKPLVQGDYRISNDSIGCCSRLETEISRWCKIIFTALIKNFGSCLPCHWRTTFTAYCCMVLCFFFGDLVHFPRQIYSSIKNTVYQMSFNNSLEVSSALFQISIQQSNNLRSENFGINI